MNQKIKLSRRRLAPTLALLTIATLFFAGDVLAQSAQQPKIFHGVGKITGLDAASGVVSIAHEDIPGLMSAMEMPFKASPAKILEALKLGDRIAFDVLGENLTIIAIKKFDTAK
jgi:Cu(I)/Ag(I) efflux system periplasmic protein CusF